jgi:hypothetical protein
MWLPLLIGAGVLLAGVGSCGVAAALIVRGAGQLGRLARWVERPGAHQPLGMGRPEAGVSSPGQLIEDTQQLGGEWGRHDTILLVLRSGSGSGG